MADLRIADAPEIALEDITGNEKVPTGGYGNSAVTINNLGQFLQTALSLATESYVSNAVGQKENKITLTGLNLTPTPTLVDIPQTNNSILNTIHQDLLNRMEWIKDNASVITDHQALTNRSTFNTHPSSSISHNGTSNVSIEIEELKNDILTINTTTIPELENDIIGKQDVIVNDVNLSETSVFGDVPSTNNSALNNSLQALTNRDKFIDYKIKAGLPPLFDSNFSTEIGGYPLNARLMLDNGDIVKSTAPNNTVNPNVDMTGWVLLTRYQLKNADDFQGISNLRGGEKATVDNFLNPNLVLSKPYFGGGGGNFVFEKDSVELTDNVYVFDGIGGKWKRVNWIKPTIYDAGIYDESLDNTGKFKALLSAVATVLKGKKEIDLDGRTLKVTDFIMYSNMFIKNGGLDFTGSTVIDTTNFAYAGLIIGENAPYRNLDPQQHARYADLPIISNFGFDNVEFTSPIATNNIRRNIMAFYKWKGFKMLRCKFNLNGARAYKLVGSFNNTNYTGFGLWDQPQPFGGYSSKAKIKFNEFIGTGYSQNTGGANIMSDTGQFAAVEDVEFAFNSSKNLMIGCHFDAYTRNSSCHHNNYEITDDMISAFANASVLDVIGVYVGQCGYGNSIYKNKIKNALRHSVYVEAGSNVDIRSNKINHSAALVATNPTVAHGITIQANLISDATSGTSFNKGCEDIEISGNTIRGLRQGIVVSSTIADSARAVNVHDNDVKVSGNLAAIYTTNIMDSNIHDNKCVGGIWLGRMLDCVVANNRAKNSSNYALYLTSGLKTGTSVVNNELYCDSGAVIYNGTTSGEVLNIFGGTIQQTAGTATIQNGSGVGTVRCYGFDNNVARKQFTHSQVVNIAAGATTLIQISHTGVKNGWLSNVSLNSMASLYTGSAINLTLKSSARADGVDILVTNSGTGAVNFTPTFNIGLDSFADNTFTN